MLKVIGMMFGATMSAGIFDHYCPRIIFAGPYSCGAYKTTEKRLWKHYRSDNHSLILASRQIMSRQAQNGMQLGVCQVWRSCAESGPVSVYYWRSPEMQQKHSINEFDDF